MARRLSLHRSAPLKVGFRNHPGAFERGEIRFFAHRVDGLTQAPSRS